MPSKYQGMSFRENYEAKGEEMRGFYEEIWKNREKIEKV